MDGQGKPNPSYEKLTTFGFAGALVVLGAAIVLLWGAEAGHGDTEKWISDRMKLHQELQVVSDEFKNAELWHQRYIVSGDADDYSSLMIATARLDEHLPMLKDNLRGVPELNDEQRTIPEKIGATLASYTRTANDKKNGKLTGDLANVNPLEEDGNAREYIKLIASAQNDEFETLTKKVAHYKTLWDSVIGLFVISMLGFSATSWFAARGPQHAIKHLEERNRLMYADLENARAQLEKLANVDFLTEVLNVRGLEQVLAVEENRAGRQGGNLVAILMNCDNFRRINEGFGHAVGDVLLKEVAKRITTIIRPSDHVARIGGDEFLILLPDTQVAYAMRVAERVRTTIAENPLRDAPTDCNLTVSAGVAQVPTQLTSIEQVVGLVRSALKRSKQGGKNRVSLAKEGGANGDALVSKDIVDVLCDGTHFRTVYQPIVKLATEKVSGYEVFSRGPDGQFESPADFFRVCIENNVLTSVDLLCLKLCIAATEGVKEHLRFHVNLFPSTIIDTPIDKLLALFPVEKDGRSFCLELSEQQFIGDPSNFRDHVNALKQAGILVAIDDIGFGRSSLESLIVLEPDVVKVDRKYVAGVSKEPNKAKLLRRVCNVAKSLGAEIVAEGIESNEDIPLLCDMGVHYGQGYLWGGLLQALPSSAGARSPFEAEAR